MTPKPVTVFLSHSSADKDLVHNVARELQKRGVYPWLDHDELLVGDNVSDKLNTALRSNDAVVVFLSDTSLKSDWVEVELKTALALEKSDSKTSLIPVFLGDMEKMVRLNPHLRAQWVNSTTDRVDRKGSITDNNPEVIAHEVCKTAFQNAGLPQAQQIAILMDVRGQGRRVGEAPVEKLPKILTSSGGVLPTLLFRPDDGERSFRETLSQERFRTFATLFKHHIDLALGGSRGRRDIYVGGDAPLAVFFWMVGYRFDRTTGATLYCHNNQTSFTFNDNSLKSRIGALPVPADAGKVLWQWTETDSTIKPVDPTQLGKKVAVVFAAKTDDSPDDNPTVYNATYVAACREDNRKYESNLPVLWLPHPQTFIDARQVCKWIEEVVGAFGWLKKEGVEHLHLYMTLPNNVVPLLAAQLTGHMAKEITLMEWTPAQGGAREYEPFTAPW